MTVYNVTVNPTENENRFQVTWHNVERNTRECFTREAEITPEDTQRLWQWSRCQLAIGQKLFRFLDGEAHYFQQSLTQAKQLGEKLQLHLRTCKEIADWPFELLAKDDTFFLPHQLHLVRSVSDWGKEKKVSLENRPLKLLFMACSAMDVEQELDFEREEEAIFHITEKLAIDMDVEDSGSLEGLRSQLEQEQYDVIHLSGHAGIDKNGRPYFIMEDETGNARRVFPDELWNEALIENPPRLLFLSGYRTGEVPESSDTSDNPGNIAEGSFARLLVEKFRVPAVLGWGRAVKDEQAVHAGKMIFHELSRGKSVLDAVQRARFELAKDFPSVDKPAWPLLRLFSSGVPLEPIVESGQRWQPKPQRMKHVFLKNSEVKVLSEGFVGRRRQLQTALRALKYNTDKIGLLLLGTGGLGKSCLSGKICERFPDYTLIIIHGRLNTITLGTALEDAFIASQDEKGQKVLSLEIEMTDKLLNLCSTSFKEKNYLLLLDDFEQNLEGADKGEPGSLLPEAANLLNVLLRSLPHSGKMTQMLITSRYDFPLSEQNRDLIEEKLENVWLSGFREPEQLKKVRELRNIFNYEEQSLVPQLLKAGCGNPRLMEWLDILVGQMVTAEVPRLVEAVKDKQEEFIREHVIRELLQRGGKELELFLRWFSIYRRPVMEEGVKKVAEKTNLSDWKELLDKGMSLSLIEHDQARWSYLVTPLLREELLKGFEQHHEGHEAAFAYYKKVCESLGSIDPILTEEWIFHALEWGDEQAAAHQGGWLIKYLRDRLALRESLRVGEWVLSKKKIELSTKHDASLLNELAFTIHNLGEKPKAIEYYEQALNIDRVVFGREHPNVAIDLNNIGGAWNDLGDFRKAIGYYEQALIIWKKAFGEKHPDVAAGMTNLGSTWKWLGDNRKAIRYYEQALVIWREVCGEKHLNVYTTLNNLGSAWFDLGDHHKAIEYYEQALAIDEVVFNPEHPNVAIRLNNLGSAWDGFGDYHKAIGYYEQALAVWKKVYGEKHPNVAATLNNLASAWKELGDYRKAVGYYEQALVIWKKVYGNKHPQTATGMNNLGLALDSLGDHRKAIGYYEQALAIDEVVFGREHPNVARELNNLASAWDELGDHRKAIGYYERALAIDEAIFGPEHANVARELNNLGSVWYGLGDHRKAIGYHEQALAVWKKVYGENHPEVAVGLNNQGSVYFMMGDKKKAKSYFEKAYEIFKKVLGDYHPNTMTVEKWLDACTEA